MSGQVQGLLNRSFAPTFLLSNTGSFAHRDKGSKPIMGVTTLWWHKTTPYGLGAH